jgi:hypothetical protein
MVKTICNLKKLKKMQSYRTNAIKKAQFAKTHLRKNRGITPVAGHLQPTLKTSCG